MMPVEIRQVCFRYMISKEEKFLEETEMEENKRREIHFLRKGEER
jgi:hypothetical protein